MQEIKQEYIIVDRGASEVAETTFRYIFTIDTIQTPPGECIKPKAEVSALTETVACAANSETSTVLMRYLKSFVDLHYARVVEELQKCVNYWT